MRARRAQSVKSFNLFILVILLHTLTFLYQGALFTPAGLTCLQNSFQAALKKADKLDYPSGVLSRTKWRFSFKIRKVWCHFHHVL